MKEYVLIRLKDSSYYEDNYEYESFLVEKSDNFQEVFNKLEEVCNNYEDFQEVEDFINDNFKRIDFIQNTIYV